MKISSLFAAVPLFALAACGGSTTDGNASGPVAPVAGKTAPAGTSWTDTVSATPEGGMRMGNPDAPLKLVEYGSRACPYCAKFDQEGFPVLKQSYIATGKLSYEFREYPVHGALDIAPILLGQCTGDPATFFPILDQMFANQQTLLANEQTVQAKVQAAQGASPNQVAVMYAEGLGYLDFMKQRGLPEDKARACLNDKARIDKLVERTKFANDKFQISGTPTFILNGQKLDAVDEWAKLEPVLKARGG
ncbi:MAG: thioredoxin domain-containing protein [Sphingomonas sp.]|uniref:thioredoxin domain-containing protein n=1 Tax=Sphingomonas sp. TaxID=28214 RepID=UPI003F800F5A